MRSAPASLLDLWKGVSGAESAGIHARTSVAAPAATGTGGFAPVVWDVIRRITSETADAPRVDRVGAQRQDEVRHAAGVVAVSVCIEGAMPVPRFVRAGSGLSSASGPQTALFVAEHKSRAALLLVVEAVAQRVCWLPEAGDGGGCAAVTVLVVGSAVSVWGPGQAPMVVSWWR